MAKKLVAVEPLDIAVPNGGTGFSVQIAVGIKFTVEDESLENVLLDSASVDEADIGNPAGTE